jgi:hypothetical protein
VVEGIGSVRVIFYEGMNMGISLREIIGKKAGFWGAKSDKAVLVEALERRQMLSGYYDENGIYVEDNQYGGDYVDPNYQEDPYGGYYGGGYGDGGYNGDPVDEPPIVTYPDMMYFEIGTPSVKIDLGNYFMDAPQMASQLTFSAGTNTDPSTAIGVDIIDNRWLFVTFDASKAGFADVEVAATDASGLTSSAYFRLIIDETAKNGPVVVTTPTITMPEDSGPVRLDLNAIFEDTFTPDSELVFGASPYLPSLIKSAEIDGHYLVVTPAANLVGGVGVVVSATDKDGQSTTYMVLVTVTDVVPTIGTVTANETEFVLGSPDLKNVEFTVDGMLVGANNKMSIFLDSDGDGLLNLTKDQRLVISPDLDGEVRHATADLSSLDAGTHTILAVAWEDNNWYSGSQLSPIASMTIQITGSKAASSSIGGGTGDGGVGEEPNTAPMWSVPDPFYFETGVKTAKVDMWEYFEDPPFPDSDMTFDVLFTGEDTFFASKEIVGNRYLVVAFASSEPGTGYVSVMATDKGFLSVDTQVTFVLDNSTNNGPSVVLTPNISVNEDSPPFTLDVAAIFEDFTTPDSGLTFSVSFFSNEELITSAKMDGTNLVVTFAANKIGHGSVVVQATDPDGKSTSYSIPVDVHNVVPTIGAVTVEANRFKSGTKALEDVGFTVTGILEGAHNRVSVFLDSNGNGVLDLDKDLKIIMSDEVAGPVFEGSADLSKLAPGQYTVFAVAWEDNTEFAGSDLSPTATTHFEIFASSEQSTKTAAGQSLTYVDSHGNTVKATLTGPGSFEIFFENAGAKHDASLIQLTGTDATKSLFTLAVTPAKGAVPTTDVGDVEIAGGLSGFTAGKANLLGDFTASGLVKAITVNDVNSLVVGEQHHIMLGGTAKDKTTLTFGHVADISLTTPAMITSLKAAEWIDGNKANDVIQAAGLGSLTLTGHKTMGTAGDFDADLTLTNPAVAKTTQSVSSITVAGSSRGSWDLGAFKLQSVSVKGTTSGTWSSDAGFVSVSLDKVDGLMLESGGDLTTFKGGQINDSHFHVASAITTFTSVNFIGGMIEARKVGSISITGRLASATQTAVAGNFTGDIKITGYSVKANAQSLVSLKVAGLVIGSNSEDPDWVIQGGVGTVSIGKAQGLNMVVNNFGGNIGNVASYKFGDGIDTILTVGGKAGSITASNWTHGSISGGSLGALNITGTRNSKGALVGGDYTGNLSFSGYGVAKNTLTIGSVNVTGSVVGPGGGSGPVWMADGNVGSISIGVAQELAIVVLKKTSIGAAGSIGSFKVGQATNVFLNADGTAGDKIGSVTAESWKGGHIYASSVGSISVKGNYEGSIDITGKGLAANAKALGSVTVGGAVVGSGTVESPDWSIKGPTGALTLGSVSGLAVHLDDAVGAIWIKAEASDLSLVANGHFDEAAGKSIFGNVASLKAGKISNSYIQIDRLTSLSVTGFGAGKGAVAGELNNTYVYIPSAGVSGKAVALGSVSVTGAVNNSELVLLGNAGVVTVGAFLSSSVRVGVSDAVGGTGLPTTDADFTLPELALGGFVVTGKAVSATAPTFVNSRVMAPTLTLVSVKLVASTLETPTGFAATHKIGNYTRLVSVTPKVTKTVTNKTAPGVYDTDGLYTLKIV